MKPSHIKAVAKKEFFHLIRDFRSLYLAFVIPLLLILLFGYALSLDVNHIKTVVVDHDNTDLSRDFIRKFQGSSYFHVTRIIPEIKAAERLLDQGKVAMALIIPAGWTNAIRADRDAPIQVLFDGSDPNSAGISQGYVTALIQTYNREQLLHFLNRKGLKRIEQPIEGRIRVWFNEDLESQNFIIPGIIAIIIMIVGAMLTSLVIAREYENGTMETIKSLPLHRGDFLLGKAIPYFFIGLTDVLIAVLMGQILYGVVMKGSFWLMILASTVYLWVALSLGLLISSVTKSQLVANQVAILVTYMPSFLLSDFVFPIANMPQLLQKLSLLIPATYFMDILNGLYLRDLGFQDMWASYLVLFVMFLILSVINVMKLKREGL